MGEAETLPPEVEDLLVKAEADQGPELDVHPGSGLVVSLVNEVNASVKQLFRAQHFSILLQPFNYIFKLFIFYEFLLLECFT